MQDKLIDPTSITHLFKVSGHTCPVPSVMSSKHMLLTCSMLATCLKHRSIRLLYQQRTQPAAHPCCASAVLQISKHIGMLATGMLGEVL